VHAAAGAVRLRSYAHVRQCVIDRLYATKLSIILRATYSRKEEGAPASGTMSRHPASAGVLTATPTLSWRMAGNSPIHHQCRLPGLRANMPCCGITCLCTRGTPMVVRSVSGKPLWAFTGTIAVTIRPTGYTRAEHFSLLCTRVGVPQRCRVPFLYIFCAASSRSCDPVISGLS
jgi:hypothetical protein